MVHQQLPIFKRKTFPAQVQKPLLAVGEPAGEGSVMSTLLAYSAHLHSKGYAASTIEKYYGDLKKFSVFISGKKIDEITRHDVAQWIETLVSKRGAHLDRKTINRKVSAIVNYFSWLVASGAITQDPTAGMPNARIQSPLPDYLYENEIKTLLVEASKDTRLYLLVLVLLETGMKSSELLHIRISDIDISDSFAPEIWIKHKGRERKRGMKKDRKVVLTAQFTQVYTKYFEEYLIEDVLFPYTDRFVQLLFADLKKRTGIHKNLTPKTLRHTHIVRSLKRGEDSETIFDRIGLAEKSRQEAYEEVYFPLVGGQTGIAKKYPSRDSTNLAV